MFDLDVISKLVADVRGCSPLRRLGVLPGEAWELALQRCSRELDVRRLMLVKSGLATITRGYKYDSEIV